MLNTTVSTSTGVDPFEVVFGRAPTDLERLEDPALFPDGDGQEFLASVKQRLMHLHQSLRLESDRIRNARAADKNTCEFARVEHARRGTVRVSSWGGPLHLDAVRLA
jgi:hypothetical protein